MGFKLIRDTFHDTIPSAYVFPIKFDAHLTLDLPWLFNTNPRKTGKIEQPSLMLNENFRSGSKSLIPSVLL